MLLNENFEVIQYTGGTYNNESIYDIKNTLNMSSYPHCSNQGKNFILKLKSKNEYYITIFTISGGKNCTAPLKNGILFISENELKMDYLKKFKNLTKEKFLELKKDDLSISIVKKFFNKVF